MLTKTDISQIRQVVKEEVRQIIKEEVDPKFQRLELKMDKEFKKVNNGIKKTVDFLDKDYLKVEKRVTRTEKILQLPPISPF